jgi:hypothetical protein
LKNLKTTSNIHETIHSINDARRGDEGTEKKAKNIYTFDTNMVY